MHYRLYWSSQVELDGQTNCNLYDYLLKYTKKETLPFAFWDFFVAFCSCYILTVTQNRGMWWNMTSMYRNTRDQKTSRWNYQIGCLFMPSRTTYSGVFRSDPGQRKTTVRLRDTMWFGLNYLFAKVRGALFAKVTVIVLKKLVFSFIFTWMKSGVAKYLPMLEQCCGNRARLIFCWSILSLDQLLQCRLRHCTVKSLDLCSRHNLWDG